MAASRDASWLSPAEPGAAPSVPACGGASDPLSRRDSGFTNRLNGMDSLCPGILRNYIDAPGSRPKIGSHAAPAR